MEECCIKLQREIEVAFSECIELSLVLGHDVSRLVVLLLKRVQLFSEGVNFAVMTAEK